MHASPHTIPSILTSLVLALTLSMSISSCSTHRHAAEVVTHTARDTLYISQTAYDSIYIDHWRTVRQQADTVYDETIRYEYRYQLLHDTVRIVQVDTVSVLQEVEVVKEITTPLTWFDRLSRTSFLLVVGLLSAYLLRSVVRHGISRS